MDKKQTALSAGVLAPLSLETPVVSSVPVQEGLSSSCRVLLAQILKWQRNARARLASFLPG